MGGAGSALFSLQSKLIGAFVLVVLAALVLAAGIFLWLRRGEQEEQALDHVIAASPVIYSDFSILQRRGDPAEVLTEYAEYAAEQQDVRILIIDRTDLTVTHDTADSLSGEQVLVPEDLIESATVPVRGRPYVSWRPGEGPARDLIFVSAVPSAFEGVRGPAVPRGEPYWLVLAVEEETVSRAWLGLLPGLGLAAAIALPSAALLALLIARYITRPLQQLTVASQRMAEGHYDVQVSLERRDEVGRLATAFSSMVRRVGEANAQMRALVANVSHDLKTPLTSILGFAQALRDGRVQGDAEVQRLGGVIHEEALRLSSRLNDLLLLSELESGQALLQRAEIDLRTLLEPAVRRIEPDVTARGVQLAVDLPEDISLSADAPKLERALENLLDNARKYTPAGGAIRVRSYSENGAAGRACVEVANSASDLAEEELPRLFERFYRHDRSRAPAGDAASAGGRSASGGGSGLGLSIARDIVELHGGALEATLHDGTIIFTARLPRAAASKQPDRSEANT